jgi:hypothetical protein
MDVQEVGDDMVMETVRVKKEREPMTPEGIMMKVLGKKSFDGLVVLD